MQHGAPHAVRLPACLYCRSELHTDASCARLLLDKMRETGHFVDFPGEDDERAAGRERIRAYAGHYGCCVADMFKPFGLRGWCECFMCERGGTGLVAPQEWIKAGNAHACTGNWRTCPGCNDDVAQQLALKSVAGGGDGGAAPGGEGGGPARAGAAEAVRHYTPDELRAAASFAALGGDGEGAGGEGVAAGGARPVVYFARTNIDLKHGYPRKSEASVVAGAAGAHLLPACVHLHGVRYQTVPGARGPQAPAEPGVAGGHAGGGEPGAAAGAGGAGGGGEPAGAEPEAGGPDAGGAGDGGGAAVGGKRQRKAAVMAPRKKVAQAYRIKREPSAGALYNKWHDHYIGQGATGLCADLKAKIQVAHEQCMCPTCEEVRECPFTLEDFVPEHEFRALWYIDQYVECSDCAVVAAVMRYEQLYSRANLWREQARDALRKRREGSK